MFQFVFNFPIAIGILPIFIHPAKIFFFFFFFWQVRIFYFLLKEDYFMHGGQEVVKEYKKKLQQIMYRTDFSNNGMESLDMKPWARDHSNKVPTKKVAISLSPGLSISSNVCLRHFLHMMHIKHHGTIFQIFGLPIQFLQSTTTLITLIHLSKFKPTKWLG